MAAPDSVCLHIGLVLQVHSQEASIQLVVNRYSAFGYDQAFLMVGSCPDSWSAEILAADGRSVVSHCESQDYHLPPMTDTSTGLVYRNEYCVICNNATQIQAWEVVLTCSYKLFRTYSEDSIETLLRRITPCKSRKYQPPPYSHPNYSCAPAIHSCLNKYVLELILIRLPQKRGAGLSGGCDSLAMSVVSAILFVRVERTSHFIGLHVMTSPSPSEAWGEEVCISTQSRIRTR